MFHSNDKGCIIRFANVDLGMSRFIATEGLLYLPLEVMFSFSCTLALSLCNMCWLKNIHIMTLKELI